MQLDRFGWAAAAALLLILLVQTARLAWLRGEPSRRLERARRRGSAGERRATALLEHHGFRIDAVQPATEWTILCDGEPHPVALRADLLVSRDGQSFIAEIKTGECAELETAATRRQLLEYSVAYAVDGVLLVDVEAGRVQEIAFPSVAAASAPSAGSSATWFWVAAMIATVLVGLYVRMNAAP
jgi:hypothetical protein